MVLVAAFIENTIINAANNVKIFFITIDFWLIIWLTVFVSNYKISVQRYNIILKHTNFLKKSFDTGGESLVFATT